MDINQMEHLLQAYNEDELFYMQYYDAKKREWNLMRFLNDIGEDEVRKRRLIVPEFVSARIPSDMADTEYFNMADERNVFLSKHNRYTPRFTHSHVFFEIAYVLSGVCKQQFDGTAVSLNAGDFCIMAPHVKHSIGVFDDSIVINILIRRSTFEDIFFNLLRGDNIVSSFFNNSLYFRKQNEYLLFHSKADVDIKNHVLAMFCEFTEEKKYYAAILDSMIMILFAKLLRHYEDQVELPPQARKRNKQEQELISYIQTNYATVALREVADQFHFSQSYCSTLIKETTGNTFSEIVQIAKLSRAEDMLTTTKATIQDISVQVGYENVEHFNRLFKRKHGISPSQFRKRNHDLSP